MLSLSDDRFYIGSSRVYPPHNDDEHAYRICLIKRQWGESFECFQHVIHGKWGARSFDSSQWRCFKLMRIDFEVLLTWLSSQGEVTRSTSSSSLETSLETETQHNTIVNCVNENICQFTSIAFNMENEAGWGRDTTDAITMIDKNEEIRVRRSPTPHRETGCSCQCDLLLVLSSLLLNLFYNHQKRNHSNKREMEIKWIELRAVLGMWRGEQRERRRERWLIMEHQDTVWPSLTGLTPLTNSLSIGAFCFLVFLSLLLLQDNTKMEKNIKIE